MKIRFIFFLFVLILVVGCQSTVPESIIPTSTMIEKAIKTPTAPRPEKTLEVPSLIDTPTPTPTAEKTSDPLILWKDSPHANTYDLGKGPNTYCAKCHSPLNWDTQAQIGTAPNCVSCKLPAENDPRISKQNPLVPAADWKNINCSICHEANGEDISPSIAWWNQEIGKYESLSNATALCNKCHVDTQIMGHTVVLSGSAHDGFECLDCHNPHSTTASCSNAGCHADVRKPGLLPVSTPADNHGQVGDPDCGGPACHISATEVVKINASIHGTVHSSVACIACHASGDIHVDRSEESGVWGIFQTVEIDGYSLTYTSNSHEISRVVDCTRCHFEGNPWDLSLVSGHEFGQ